MDGAIPVDAKNAPTGMWKTAPSAVSHTAHTPRLFVSEEESRPKSSTLINLSTDSDQVHSNATAFSFLYALILDTLPVPRPEELVLLHSSGAAGTTDSADRAVVAHYEGVPELFAGVLWDGGVSESSVTVAGATTEWLRALVSDNYFTVLGLRAAVGRLDSDDGRQGRAAVLDYERWRSQFELAGDVLGRSITIGGELFTVVGVAPKDFFGLTVGLRPDVYTLTPRSEGPV